jgi:adenosine deaminase
MKKENPGRRLCAAGLLCLLAGFAAVHLQASKSGEAAKAARDATGEEKAEERLNAARANPEQLREWLIKMPKGADLHYHLSGGVYAESFISWAAEDGLCVDIKKLALTKCAAPGETSSGVVPASDAFRSHPLYDQLVDSFSMRDFQGTVTSGHDHFFSSFDKFGGISARHRPEEVEEVASRAALENEQYMELMISPDYALPSEVTRQIGQKLEEEKDKPKDLKDLCHKLGKGQLKEAVERATRAYDELDKQWRKLQDCADPAAAGEACKMDVRYICQVLRGKSKEIVLTQLLVCFQAAEADPERVVGLNMVMPEDGKTAMGDYDLHMSVVKSLRAVYPNVHVSLHAGELAPGIAPNEALCCHIRKAVDAGAERIGHGADLLHEQHWHQLIEDMAAKHVMVEINLSSNDLILGVSGENHPLPVYRQFEVPVALSTDDEGVSRIDLTNEYVRAVRSYRFSYQDLKKMARTGMEHAFLPGGSLWAAQDVFSKTVSACAKEVLGAENTSKDCARFLKKSEKAAAQWELERRFVEFEAGL